MLDGDSTKGEVKTILEAFSTRWTMFKHVKDILDELPTCWMRILSDVLTCLQNARWRFNSGRDYNMLEEFPQDYSTMDVVGRNFIMLNDVLACCTDDLSVM